MICDIDDDECAGPVLAIDYVDETDLLLCQSHRHDLSDLGLTAFVEWFSEELGRSLRSGRA